MMEPATGLADTTMGIAIPFLNTLTAVMEVAVAKVAPPTLTPWLFTVALLVKGELIEVIVGGGGSTLKTTAPVVPPGVVTVILRFPWAAAAVMTNEALICVELTTETIVAVMPAPALMEVAPVRLVPVRVTGTVWPAWLDAEIGRAH